MYSHVPNAIHIPKEIISQIIRHTLAGHSHRHNTNLRLLFTLALVSKAWGKEAQHILFEDESLLFTKGQIDSWLLAVPRFMVRKLSVHGHPRRWPQAVALTLEDMHRVLKGLQQHEATALVDLSLQAIEGLTRTSDVLGHRSLAGLKTLDFYFTNQTPSSSLLPSTPTPNANILPLPFSLSSLTLRTNLSLPETPSGTFNILEALITTHLRLEGWGCDHKDFDGDLTTSHIFARPIRSAGEILTTLFLKSDESDPLFAALKACRILEGFKENPMQANRWGVVAGPGTVLPGLDPILLALPDSLRKYEVEWDDLFNAEDAYEELAKVLLSGDGVLPNLKQVGSVASCEEDCSELWEEVKVRRPMLQYFPA